MAISIILIIFTPILLANGMERISISQLSASKQRKFALDDDLDGFMGGVLSGENFSESDAKQLFDAIKMFSQVQEEWEVDSREHADYIRELYREGELFSEG